jgi:Holliday junction resolvase RusA-like endonuclease
MTRTLCFTVHGDPVGKERPRKGRGKRFYTPDKTKDYEQKVGMMFLKAAGGKLDPPAIWVRVHCYFKNGRHADPDNVLKCALDGLCKLAFRNDNKVASSVNWSMDAKHPRIEVELG